MSLSEKACYPLKWRRIVPNEKDKFGAIMQNEELEHVRVDTVKQDRKIIDEDVFCESDVKESVKRLKKRLKKHGFNDKACKDIYHEIDEEFGGKLI